MRQCFSLQLVNTHFLCGRLSSRPRSCVAQSCLGNASPLNALALQHTPLRAKVMKMLLMGSVQHCVCIACKVANPPSRRELVRACKALLALCI